MSDWQCHGVDVSEFQAPGRQPADAEFVIARATFGARKDKRADEHLARARAVGATVGLYHFFVSAQQVTQQADVFLSVARGLVWGDMIPWVDVESPAPDGGLPPAPSWCDRLSELLDRIVEEHGSVGVYISVRDWTLLGSPKWLLEFPLWVPHYRTSRGEPATPGGVRPVIWQYRVGRWKPGACHVMGEHAKAGAIDHDVCGGGGLPLLRTTPAEAIERTEPDVRSRFAPSLDLDDDYWAEHRRVRDLAVREAHS
jgi:hypothetical protein